MTTNDGGRDRGDGAAPKGADAPIVDLFRHAHKLRAQSDELHAQADKWLEQAHALLPIVAPGYRQRYGADPSSWPLPTGMARAIESAGVAHATSAESVPRLPRFLLPPPPSCAFLGSGPATCVTSSCSHWLALDGIVTECGPRGVCALRDESSRAVALFRKRGKP